MEILYYNFYFYYVLVSYLFKGYGTAQLDGYQKVSIYLKVSMKNIFETVNENLCFLAFAFFIYNHPINIF